MFTQQFVGELFTLDEATVVTQQEVQRDLEGAREQIKRMRFELEA
jgi:hypothetical protein